MYESITGLYSCKFEVWKKGMNILFQSYILSKTRLFCFRRNLVLRTSSLSRVFYNAAPKNALVSILEILQTIHRYLREGNVHREKSQMCVCVT